MNSKESFEKNWEKFIKQLKGKLIAQKEKQNFSYPAVKLILAEAVTAWENKYDECGRWLIEYSKENPEKGELIKQIIIKDMKFTEITVKKDSFNSVGVIASAAAGVIGFGISSFFNVSNLVTAAATLIPAVAAYPAVSATGNMMKAKKDDEVLEEYLAQLEKFRLSIVNVIGN